MHKCKINVLYMYQPYCAHTHITFGFCNNTHITGERPTRPGYAAAGFNGIVIHRRGIISMCQPVNSPGP